MYQKKYELAFYVFLVLVCSLGPVTRAELPVNYQKWLEEEVVYIISSSEKEVFLQLESDRERHLFVQAFWRHRDPSPGSSNNEFKDEHFRRLQHVQVFGRGTTKDGWQTDRGRIYIILGEPNDVQRFESHDQVYPSEVWFYQGMSHRGLPPAFHLIFFQERGIGDYRLYSPLSDGPQALLTSYYGDPVDYLAAYRQLREFVPELSNISLALIPGDSAVQQGRPSLTSDLLVNKIDAVPLDQVEDRYARKFLEYKDVVEVEYSTNFIDSESLIHLTTDPSGITFVQYALEPERLSFRNVRDRFTTTLRLNGSITDATGKAIYQFKKDIDLDFTEAQLQQITHRPVSIRDVFPLIPGDFHFSVLLQNEASQEFTSMEKALHIPMRSEEPQITALLLGYKMNQKSVPQGGVRPFQSGLHQINFQANRVFLQKDQLVVVFQIQGLGASQRDQADLRFTLLHEGREVHSFVKPLAAYTDAPDYLEVLSLDKLIPAHYRIRVSLEIKGQELLKAENEFDVTHAESIPRPWVYSKVVAGIHDPIYAYTLGIQMLNSGNTQEAKDFLEKAYQTDPKNLEFALGFVRVLLISRAYTEIPPVLSPFLLGDDAPRFEVFTSLGEAHRQMGEYRQAVPVFQAALTHHGLAVPVLNALADCYDHLGQFSLALSTWEKSLEINPQQAAVVLMVKRMKERK